MCGIAGFIDHRAPGTTAETRLRGMLAQIAHRGPDGESAHVAPQFALAMGMRRLSIIDLEGGTQPIWNEDHTVGVVFNGEIYNYVELRDELRGKGHQFKTDSDTEVLVHLYEEHGEKMLDRLRGMFGFAILDERSGSLLVARDHFGQKPLYYAQETGRFAFASELKCLHFLPWVSRELDETAYLDYLTWLSLPSPRTHFRGVRKLAPGHFLRIPLSAPETAKPQLYYRYDLQAAPDLTSLEPAVEALDAALVDSLKVHLRADVPLGVLLSSGLDSRTVAAYSQEALGGGMQTFTVGFKDADSELKEAAETAAEIKSTHHSVELTAQDFLDDLPTVAWHLDEPIGDPAAFAVRRICLQARQHVKVLLSGEGSDELFGGYDTRYLGLLNTLERSAKLRPLGCLLPDTNLAAPRTRWQRLLERVHRSEGADILHLREEGFPGDIRTPRVLTLEQRQRLQLQTEKLAAEVVRPQRDLLSTIQVLDLEWQLAESLLQKADKMSMAASIELRTPLLDTRLAAVAARMPKDLKLPADGPGKLILRHTLARRLNEPLTRPKRGFPIPLDQWFRGPLKEPMEADIFAQNAHWRSLLDAKRVREAWDDFQTGRWSGGARPLYAVWLYEAWLAERNRVLPPAGEA